MSTPTDHARALPASVVERCAATASTYGGCHGASATGTNDLAAENAAVPLRELAEDMAVSYARWAVEQARTGDE